MALTPLVRRLFLDIPTELRLGLTWRSHVSMLKSPPISDALTDLTDGEALLIDAIADQNTSQRGLARAAGMSLGMTNLLIKRLVKKGFIKIVTLNGRTLSYILTPKGFAEKLKRSYDYVARSIRYIGGIREKIRRIVADRDPDVTVYVLGSGEVANLAAETLREIGRAYVVIESLDMLPDRGSGLCLVCAPELALEQPAGFDLQLLF